jgi:hypothetical protein
MARPASPFSLVEKGLSGESMIIDRPVEHIRLSASVRATFFKSSFVTLSQLADGNLVVQPVLVCFIRVLLNESIYQSYLPL